MQHITAHETCAMQPSLMQYVDALRLGDIELFKEIEEESGDWWFATLDRGAGALLHFAAEHGQVTLLSQNVSNAPRKSIHSCA